MPTPPNRPLMTRCGCQGVIAKQVLTGSGDTHTLLSTPPLREAHGERICSSWLAGVMLIFIVAEEGVAGLDQALKFNGITTKVGMNALDLHTESGDHFMTAGICLDTE